MLFNMKVRIVMAYHKFLFSWQMMFRLYDVGLGVLLSFFSTLLSIIGGVFQVDLLNDFAAKYHEVYVLQKSF